MQTGTPVKIVRLAQSSSNNTVLAQRTVRRNKAKRFFCKQNLCKQFAINYEHVFLWLQLCILQFELVEPINTEEFQRAVSVNYFCSLCDVCQQKVSQLRQTVRHHTLLYGSRRPQKPFGVCSQWSTFIGMTGTHSWKMVQFSKYVLSLGLFQFIPTMFDMLFSDFLSTDLMKMSSPSQINKNVGYWVMKLHQLDQVNLCQHTGVCKYVC